MLVKILRPANREILLRHHICESFRRGEEHVVRDVMNAWVKQKMNLKTSVKSIEGHAAQKKECDMFTCCNDSKTGTREDVSIVTLAWLVCLQPVSNYQSIHQIFGQMPLLAFSLPFQIRGSLGRGSPTQTMPCHRCGCTPDHLFVIKCEIIQ